MFHIPAGAMVISSSLIMDPVGSITLGTVSKTPALGEDHRIWGAKMYQRP